MELQRLLQQHGMGALAAQALRRADQRHAQLSSTSGSSSRIASSPLLEAAEDGVTEEGTRSRSTVTRNPGSDHDEVMALAQSINASDFVSARHRAQSMSNMPAAHRRHLSSVSGLQQARERAVARGKPTAGDPNPDNAQVPQSPRDRSAATGRPAHVEHEPRASPLYNTATAHPTGSAHIPAVARGNGAAARAPLPLSPHERKQRPPVDGLGPPPPKPPLPPHVR